MKSNRIIRALWGDLHGEELKKFLFLALGFFFLLGSYWPIRTFKDSIFMNMVGSAHQPTAKMLSVLFCLPLVLIYSWIIDKVSKERLIYTMVGIFGSLGLVFVYLLNDPIIGLANTVPSADRLLGWGFYLFVESYATLMVHLYWSYINDISTPDSAKKGYGLIIFGTQLGAFLFTAVGTWFSLEEAEYATRAPRLLLACFLFIFVFGSVVYLFANSVSKKVREGYHGKHTKPEEKTSRIGFLEGLRILISQPYVAGIFGIIFFQDMVTVIMEFHMNWQIEHTFNTPGLRNSFCFKQALILQAIACLFGLFGTSYFHRTFGIRFCIIAFPVLLGCAIGTYVFYPTLYVILGVVVVAKALNYAFNGPAKEILYIPTTKDAKYKSKAWIDMFGSRTAKALASSFNKWLGPVAPIAGGFTLVLIGLWVVLAANIGTIFQKATAENKLIE